MGLLQNRLAIIYGATASFCDFFIRLIFKEKCIVELKIVHYLLYENKNNGGCRNVINWKRNRRF